MDQKQRESAFAAAVAQHEGAVTPRDLATIALSVYTPEDFRHAGLQFEETQAREWLRRRDEFGLPTFCKTSIRRDGQRIQIKRELAGLLEYSFEIIERDKQAKENARIRDALIREARKRFVRPTFSVREAQALIAEQGQSEAA